MDTEFFLQDIVRCHLCETPAPTLHSEICVEHICKSCQWKHLLDISKRHNIVSFQNRKIVPHCREHLPNKCTLFCNQCDTPICAQCLNSNDHKGHHVSDIFEFLNGQKEIFKKELNEIEKIIYPKYQHIANKISIQKNELKINSENLTKDFNLHGKVWHEYIDSIINELKTDLRKTYSEQFSFLHNLEGKITRCISDIQVNIKEIRNVLKSNHIHFVFACKSRNAEFRRFPPTFRVSLPSFIPHKVDQDLIHKLFGSMAVLSVGKDSPIMDLLVAQSSLSYRPLIDKPCVITDIQTAYKNPNGLRSVVCIDYREVWSCGGDSIMRLYDISGNLVKSIKTRSNNRPWDIAVTKRGNLVYTDCNDKTVNMLKNTEIQETIRLQDWKPLNLCSTYSDDILIIMISKDFQNKVVRYCDSKEIQSIQFNEKGKPLYSSDSIKYISENMNRDICGALWIAGEVVVVDQDGQYRFTYKGPQTTQTTQRFYPRGITTDRVGS